MSHNTMINEELVQQVVEFGFGREMAIKALKKANNNVNRALDFLLSDNAMISDDEEDKNVVVHHHNEYDTTIQYGGDSDSTTTIDSDTSPYRSPSDTINQNTAFDDEELEKIGDPYHNEDAAVYVDTKRESQDDAVVIGPQNRSSTHHGNVDNHQQVDRIPDLEEVGWNMADSNDPYFFDTRVPDEQVGNSRSRYDAARNAASSSSCLNNSYEDALNRAIQASLQDQKRDSEPKSPVEKYRKHSHIPVGLKNIGNTCYVNSLFQAYFMIPKLKKLIFSFSEEEFQQRVQAKILKVQQSNITHSESLEKVNTHSQQVPSLINLLERQAKKDCKYLHSEIYQM